MRTYGAYAMKEGIYVWTNKKNSKAKGYPTGIGLRTNPLGISKYGKNIAMSVYPLVGLSIQEMADDKTLIIPLELAL